MSTNPPLPPNTKYKGGRRPPDPAHAARSIKFRTIWKGTVPDHPAFEDYAAIFKEWQMLGNDQYGDCVAVAVANMLRIVTRYLDTEVYLSQEAVYDIYRTQNPNFPQQDEGMNIQTLMEWMNKNPIPGYGNKIVAFASVDIADKHEMEAAAAIFGTVMLGIWVSNANMEQFDRGDTWRIVPGSPNLGGHAVGMGGYDESMGFRFLTWAKETSMGLDFIGDKEHGLEECWLPIFPEHLGTKAFQENMDLNALAAAYLSITGRPLPIPAPPPAPEPPPSPEPTPTPEPVPVPKAPQWVIDLLTRLLETKGMPRWFKNFLKGLIQGLSE